MEFALSRRLVSRLVVLAETGSTNDELLDRASVAAGRQEWPDFSAIVTTNQTAGRGRLGREWLAPAGQTLAVSVVLRPTLPDGTPLGIEHYGWLPLIAGLAMTRAVAVLLGVPGEGLAGRGHQRGDVRDGATLEVSMKWPNDVLIDGHKVSGLLAELLPGGDGVGDSDGGGVIQGAGLNLTIPRDALPTPTSTSLSLHGPVIAEEGMVDAALAAYLGELKTYYADFLSRGASPQASGIRDQLYRWCSTFGQRVKVDLPGGEVILGTATGLDWQGRLQLASAGDGEVQAVAAGDVTHLRYE